MDIGFPVSFLFLVKKSSKLLTQCNICNFIQQIELHLVKTNILRNNALMMYINYVTNMY